MGFGKVHLPTERERQYHERMNEHKSRRGTRIGMELAISQLDAANPGKVDVASGTPMNPSEGQTFQANEERELAIELDSLVPPVRGSCEDSSHPPMTVYQGYKKIVAEMGDSPQIFWKNSHKEEYKHWTVKEYYDQNFKFAKSLLSMGFPVHGAVSILGFNSKEWMVSLNGAIAAGGMGVGIYTSNLPAAAAYVVEHSESFVITVEDDKQRAKLEEVSCLLLLFVVVAAALLKYRCSC